MFHSNTICFYTIVNKGIGSNLMKITAKRRRGRDEIKEEKKQEEARLANIEEKMARFDAMAEQLAAYEADKKTLAHVTDVVNGLVDKGMVVVDPNGNVQAI